MLRACAPRVIREVLLRGALVPSEQRLLRQAQTFLEREMDCEIIRLRQRETAPEVRIGLPDWGHRAVDVLGFDRLIEGLSREGAFRVELWTLDWLVGTGHALELLTRYQRLLPVPRRHLPMPKQELILAAHRSYYPLADRR